MLFLGEVGSKTYRHKGGRDCKLCLTPYLSSIYETKSPLLSITIRTRHSWPDFLSDTSIISTRKIQLYIRLPDSPRTPVLNPSLEELERHGVEKHIKIPSSGPDWPWKIGLVCKMSYGGYHAYKKRFRKRTLLLLRRKKEKGS